MRFLSRSIAALALSCLVAFAQVPEKMVGSITAISLEKASVDVKAQDGTSVTIHLTSDTVLQRIAPGEKSLKTAEAIQVTDMSVGDKVLVNNDVASGMARRIVVMSAVAITKHDEADRQAWIKNGISGIVVSKTGDDITLRQRAMGGETQAHVIVSKDTGYKRYAADSVRFSDAKSSNFADIKVGDQLRAKGDKSEDGLKVAANEVVFGTFVTKAGIITAVDTEHNSVLIKELNTNKPLNVKLTADTQLKQMPNFAGMFAGAGGMPGAGASPAAGGPPAGAPGAGPNGGAPRRMPDMAQMIERMPAVKLDALKVGDTVVMSSTQGKSETEFTAIVLLDNAEMLVRMAAMQRSGGAGSGAAGAGMQGGGMQGMGGMQGGLELPGIMQ